jgi:hypothetical protein
MTNFQGHFRHGAVFSFEVGVIRRYRQPGHSSAWSFAGDLIERAVDILQE